MDKLKKRRRTFSACAFISPSILTLGGGGGPIKKKMLCKVSTKVEAGRFAELFLQQSSRSYLQEGLAVLEALEVAALGWPQVAEAQEVLYWVREA